MPVDGVILHDLE